MQTPQTTYRFSTQAGAAQRSEIRELLKRSQTPGMLSLAGGIPAAELIDTVGLCEAANKALAAPQPVGLQYGQTEGQSALRAQIQRWMAAQGLAFVPGAAFYAKNPNRHSLRLSYSNLAPQDAPEAVRRLALALESLNECRSERMNEHMKETA